MSGIDLSAIGATAGVAGKDTVAGGTVRPEPPVVQVPQPPPAPSTNDGLSIMGFQVLFSPGPVDPTQEFALKVRGVGFFQLDSPQGVRLTRTAGFHVDAGGNLVSSQGLPVTPPVQVPADAQSILVTNDGRVLALLASGSVVLVGVIELATVPNVGGLLPEGAGVFAPTAASGAPQPGATGQIQFQGRKGLPSVPAAGAPVVEFGRPAGRTGFAVAGVSGPGRGALVDVLG
ncbi:MAG TPA: hypothetical protein VEN81_02270 [Planctomycetota bacterium]|nr:hypothetical protein [Planctomycetota bacterium]